MTDQEKVECVICLEPLTSQTIWGCCRQPCYQQCRSRKSGVCDLFGTTDKSNHMEMLSSTMLSTMCQPMEKYPSHHLLSLLSANDSHRRIGSQVQ